MNLGQLLVYCWHIRRHIGVTSNKPGICQGFSFAVIARLSSEKSKESEQLYKAEQRHQIMADQATAMKSQMKTKDDQITALTAQIATLT